MLLLAIDRPPLRLPHPTTIRESPVRHEVELSSSRATSVQHTRLENAIQVGIGAKLHMCFYLLLP